MRSARFDSSTGKRRSFWYSWRALAAGLALALVAGGGIAVAAVSTASAHIPTITVTCEGIHVVAEKYNQYDTNTVTVTIDGNAQLGSPLTFITDFDKFFPFPTATDGWNYTAEIKTTDATPAYSKSVSGTSTPCAPPSILSIDIPTCTVPGGTTDITASVGGIDTSHAYTIELSSPEAGATNIAAAAFTPGAATGTYPFPGVAPGHTYTVTVRDTTIPGLSASSSATSIGCPHDAGVDVTAEQCTVPGGNATFDFTATGLVLGRNYTVVLTNLTTSTTATTHVVGDATGTYFSKFPAAAGATYKASITDDLVGAASTRTTDPKAYLPCPQTFPKPSLLVDPCTSTSPPSNAVLSYLGTGLVPGRQYTVTVTDAASANLVPPVTFTASSSTYPTNGVAAEIPNIDPGNYTVTVTDLLVPSFTQFEVATIILCPAMPELAFTPTQCTVPGGTASISTAVTNYIAGRTYLVGLTLVQGGAVVVAPTPVVAPASGTWALAAFPNLAPGTQYRVTVTDSVVTSVSASGDVSLKDCPGMPSITVQATCNVLGASTVNVSLDKLTAGETYTVNIVNASTNKNVGTATVPGTSATASLQLKNVPNGNQYTITVANQTNTLTGSASAFIKNCDLPTLAFTGANPVGPAVAGIGFLQFGLVLVGLGLVAKRRRRTA
jgi:hypothetical protein